MDIESKKLPLIEWVTQLEDEDTLNCPKEMKETSETSADWWDNLSGSQRVMDHNPFLVNSRKAIPAFFAGAGWCRKH